MPTTLELLLALTAIIVALYYYFISNYNFWKERGVAGPKPKVIVGNIGRVLIGNISMGDYLKELYDDPKFKNEPMIGIYAKSSPVLILKDLEMIKHVLIKDFSKISDRGVTTSAKAEPLSQHLFSLEPKRWRPLRTRLSPVFTSGKLKEMFGLLTECADHYENYLDRIIDRGEPIDCHELTAKFTTDVIGSCAFGLEMNAIGDEDSEFRKMGRSVFEVSLYNILRNRLRNSAPWLFEILINFMPRDRVTTFFKGSIVNTIKYREDNKICRNDFVNLLMELKKNPEKLNGIELTDDLLAAQAFVFFLAGFETSSTTMTHALYELALNPTMQDKLRQEINKFYEQNGEKLQYEGIKEMVYLDQIFRETLRKYPPVTFLMRKTMTDYTFENTKVTIPKDIRIWIPIYAIQRDPEIFSSPDVFKPERFNDETDKTRHAMSYLPFGDGPRNCIGSRFAVYQSKVGLIKTLRKFKVEICDKTPIPYKNNAHSFILSPTEKIYLKFTRVN
ncbi:PREDICTED: probable cytochrome P450 6a14 [Polistes dominula]|uniref:Probable cytochrome P450 6a14 n=1 Tax=Polistes dominula TaxID=743375 RepID=A0ABM1ITF6_POLDO|nr:PREDICTED: probable cytochrome P450 6a14 [Polistes dominula]